MALTFWRPDIYWTDQLRWHERTCVAAWWCGKVGFAASILTAGGMVIAAVWAPIPGLSGTAVLEGSASTLLAGIAVLIVTRLILVLAIRASADRDGRWLPLPTLLRSMSRQVLPGSSSPGPLQI